jgi:hypothetical protein
VWIKQLLLVVCVVGCGQVNARPDAAIEGPPDAFACTGGQLTCGMSSTCFDLQTDEAHCGTCNNACTGQQGCAAGMCIDATASCANIKVLDPKAPSQEYLHTADGSLFFCDMTKEPPVQYEALAMGRYNGTYAGYTIITGADLADTTIAAAFVYLFNRQGGMTALETWSAGNVCTTTSTAGGQRLQFGGSLLFPSQGAMQLSQFTMGMRYGEELVNKQPVIFMVAPIAPNFFVTNPPTDLMGNCSDSNNPALYFKKH